MTDFKKLKSSVQNVLLFSMQYGFVLGLFWFIKYIFCILYDVRGHSGAWHYLLDHFIYIFNILNIGTLLLFYVLINRYRDRRSDGMLSYWKAVAFSTLMFFFASLIESIAIYVHIAFINPGFITENGRVSLQITEHLVRIFSEPTQSINVAKSLRLTSNAEYIVNNIYVSTLYGFLLSLFYGIFVRRKSEDKQ